VIEQPQNGSADLSRSTVSGGRRSNKDGAEVTTAATSSVANAQPSDRSSVKDKELSTSMAAAAAAAVNIPVQLPPNNSDFETRLKEQSVEISAQDRYGAVKVHIFGIGCVSNCFIGES
jgi:hypothetical protein